MTGKLGKTIDQLPTKAKIIVFLKALAMAVGIVVIGLIICAGLLFVFFLMAILP